MFEVYCNMLNQFYVTVNSEMQAKMRTLALTEMYKMLGALSSCLHLFHNVPTRYVLFLLLYSWRVKERLYNLSKYPHLVYSRVRI